MCRLNRATSEAVGRLECPGHGGRSLSAVCTKHLSRLVEGGSPSHRESGIGWAVAVEGDLPRRIEAADRHPPGVQVDSAVEVLWRGANDD